MPQLLINKKDIKPKVNAQSDFFSWQLYRWIRADPSMCEVWKGTWNFATGVDPSRPQLYIGIMGLSPDEPLWFSGRQLSSLCVHRQTITGYAFSPDFDTANWENVTEWFWPEYMRIGVCAIHGDLAHEWKTTGDVRECSRCKKVERQESRMVEKKFWVEEKQEQQDASS